MAFSLKDSLNFTGTGTSSSVHLNNLSSGDAAFVGITINSTLDSVSTVTDSSGNTYTRCGGYQGTGAEVELWYSPNTGTLNNGTTWTITPTGGTLIWAASVFIFSGLGTAGVFDKTAGGTATASTSVTTASTSTTSNASELLIGIGGGTHNRPWSPGTSYTSINQASNSATVSVFAEYQTVSSTGAYTASGTIDLANNLEMGIFTFTAAAIGPGVTASFGTSRLLTGMGT